MVLQKVSFRFSFWVIVLACLLLAAITWYWYGQQIDTIDQQIEILHQ